MHDHFSEFYEWDEDNKRPRRKRTARDREQIHFPVTLMDAAQALGFSPTVSDGSVDHAHPCRPGFRLAGTNDAAKLAADAAYEEMRTRMSNAWRKDKDRRDPVRDRGSRQPMLDELEAAATAAYEARSERMRTAWKTHHA
jgi:hypothetical protein